MLWYLVIVAILVIVLALVAARTSGRFCPKLPGVMIDFGATRAGKAKKCDCREQR